MRDGRLAGRFAFLALVAKSRLLDRSQPGRRGEAADAIHAGDLLRIALLHQGARAGDHVDDVVDLLGALGREVEIVPHDIGLARDHRRQQAGPAAQLELELAADALERGAHHVGVGADDVVEILRVAETVGRALAILPDDHLLAGEASGTWPRACPARISAGPPPAPPEPCPASWPNCPGPLQRRKATSIEPSPYPPRIATLSFHPLNRRLAGRVAETSRTLELASYRPSSGAFEGGARLLWHAGCTAMRVLHHSA